MRYNRIHVRGEYALLRLDQTNGRMFNFSTGILKKNSMEAFYEKEKFLFRKANYGRSRFARTRNRFATYRRLSQNWGDFV